jgi:lytic murein transglycosylase
MKRVKLNTRFLWLGLGALVALSANGQTAKAAQCGDGGAGFGAWLEQFKEEAASQGISGRAINSALSGVSYDPGVIRMDRGQHSFKLSFDQFYARRVNGALIARGKSLMRRYGDILSRIEHRFGVPGAVVLAIWGLETNYGGVSSGRYSIIRSLATLAHDCRRSEFFTGQLLDALRIVDKGDLSPSQLRGGWAGEIGQTQFLPTPYIKFAVDFDGNGHRDLIHSVPDILASTANFLASHGWQRGQPWGPGTANYGVIAEWNKADVYDRTIAVMASKLAGEG